MLELKTLSQVFCCDFCKIFLLMTASISFFNRSMFQISLLIFNSLGLVSPNFSKLLSTLLLSICKRIYLIGSFLLAVSNASFTASSSKKFICISAPLFTTSSMKTNPDKILPSLSKAHLSITY